MRLKITQKTPLRLLRKPRTKTECFVANTVFCNFFILSDKTLFVKYKININLEFKIFLF